MRILALSSPKGGVGKTTSSLYLSTRLAEALGGTREQPVVGLVDRDENRNLSLLLKAQPELLRPGVVLLGDVPAGRSAAHLRVVIIDTPPGHTAIKALREAQLIIVPVIPSGQSVLALGEYLRNLEHHRVVGHAGLRLLALLPTMVRLTTAHRQRLADLKAIAAAQRPPLLILPGIPQRTRIEEHDLDAPEYNVPAEEVLTHAQIIEAPLVR
jgi:cellulose biosynthesis protein BcsQ